MSFNCLISLTSMIYKIQYFRSLHQAATSWSLCSVCCQPFCFCLLKISRTSWVTSINERCDLISCYRTNKGICDVNMALILLFFIATVLYRHSWYFYSTNYSLFRAHSLITWEPRQRSMTMKRGTGTGQKNENTFSYQPLVLFVMRPALNL